MSFRKALEGEFQSCDYETLEFPKPIGQSWTLKGVVIKWFVDSLKLKKKKKKIEYLYE